MNLQQKTNPLDYKRIPFEQYKNTTPAPVHFGRVGDASGRNDATNSSKAPKGTVFGAQYYAPVDSTRKDIMR